MSRPVVAIVGRPNVGKSSLFNRIVGSRIAIVDPTPGVTRDRNYGIAEWQGREFHLVDTGGMVPQSEDLMQRLITDQALFAIGEADVILFVVDAQTGVDPHDRDLARQLQQTQKPVLVAANKADNELLEAEIYDFLKLGLGDPSATSATAGSGIGDLLDRVVELFPSLDSGDTAADGIRVALIGRPNVGKSSFINRLLGEERLIVSNIAGTTRDAIDSRIEYGGNSYVLIDTAGIRRRYKVVENIEFYTNLRTTRALETAEVAVVLIDAVDGVTTQDQRILTQVLESRRAAVLAINKWDLIAKDTHTADRFTKEVERLVAMNAYVPLLYISALTGQRVTKVLDTVRTVHAEYHRRISTAELNDFLNQALARRKPPARQGKFIQIKYLTQSEVAPPTFIFFANHVRLIDKSYVQYLTNRLRETFGFTGVPIRLKFKAK